MSQHNPLADPAPLVRRVYSYVAYRVGDGPDAEDITSEVFERAVRYRSSYDPGRGSPIGWLIGIARKCVDGRPRHATTPLSSLEEQAGPDNLEASTMERLSIEAAISRLDPRSQHLLALRHGADLSAREIGRILDLKKNAVDVAIHRAHARVRQALEEQQDPSAPDHPGSGAAVARRRGGSTPVAPKTD